MCKFKTNFRDKFKASLNFLTNNLGILLANWLQWEQSQKEILFWTATTRVWNLAEKLWERCYAFFIESNKILIPFSDLDEQYKKGIRTGAKELHYLTTASSLHVIKKMFDILRGKRLL